jgi:hypothetical protein
VELQLSDSIFRLYGKRADVALNYDLCCNGERVGRGQKKMVMSGLREYDQASIDALVQRYGESKSQYSSNDH